MTENQKRERITVTIRPDLLATLNSFAKDSGRSRSNAFEHIIGEWQDLKNDFPGERKGHNETLG